MNSGEMEEEIKRLEAKATYLMDRLQMCYVEVEEWRTKYESLDDEKVKGFRGTDMRNPQQPGQEENF